MQSEKLKYLNELEKFDYDISMVGKKISEDEKLNLNSYGIIIIIIYLY